MRKSKYILRFLAIITLAAVVFASCATANSQYHRKGSNRNNCDCTRWR
ncbi:MAG: hypothetical protein IJK92_02470 [Bacteroidales bacterium]|nr:hypothetical protein [Bacteroidales bacterium]